MATDRDAFDRMWITPAVQLAHRMLKEHAAGPAFDGEPFMGTSTLVWEGISLIACSCFYHTVLFFSGKNGCVTCLIFSRDEGGMVPWCGGLPDPDYIEKAARIPEVSFSDLWARTSAHLADVQAATT
ncbi:hypothetical protein [Burkholderia sp. MBR-1]|uniref:hypothetical protein n=1 Tax=Burkholderia sp. MBR-1 TaxID=2732364 RepID=UPI0015EEEA75|nr:hypothetical protein [Burkholderia sp. MBR-1]QMI49723.1 hypothetical protein MBR110_30070 [Burkholderia sp. MBR-1]